MSIAYKITQVFPRSAALNALRSSRYRAERDAVLLVWKLERSNDRYSLEQVRERAEGIDGDLVDGLVGLLMVDGLLSYKVFEDGSFSLFPSARGKSRIKKILLSRIKVHRKRINSIDA